MNTETGYNGWTNWETWHTSLVAENDEPTYRQGRVMAKSCLKFETKGQFDWTRAEQGFKRTFAKAWRETKDFCLSNHREYGDGWKLSPEGVNWREIAEHWIDREREEDEVTTLRDSAILDSLDDPHEVAQ